METLKPLIEQLVTMIKEGYDLTKGQLPEIAQEILQYNKAISISGIFLGVLLFILGISIFFAIRNHSKNCKSDYCDCAFAGYFQLAVCGIFGVATILVNLATVLKIYLAPKLFLLDYIQRFLK